MFAPYLAPVGVLTFLTLSQNVIADGLFVGCYKNGAFTAQINPAAADSLSCSTVCGNGGYAYSAFESDTAICSCSANFPAGYYLTSGTEEACTVSSSTHVRVTKTSFDYVACLDSAAFESDGYEDTQVSNPKDCLAACASAAFATFRGTLSATYTCHCAQEGLQSTGNSGTCAANEYFVFDHSPEAQASSLARRRSRETREYKAQQQQRRTEYCPYGLTACNVGGYSGNYECLDIHSELESCGGCMYGQYGNATAVVGQDCTNIGATLGASSCVNGQCVALACKRGLKLVDGKCQ
ncbi:hypothetical protein V865_002831 [Kwoniella europaea PYCC6329]|uniref:Protein CPL1-like domain-containing protein n=1 Tax=Kwoniella europaea PYCC6329 TaxID=1423913 RepID=A0AAX4KEB7_9TREE